VAEVALVLLATLAKERLFCLQNTGLFLASRHIIDSNTSIASKMKLKKKPITQAVLTVITILRTSFLLPDAQQLGIASLLPGREYPGSRRGQDNRRFGEAKLLPDA
jgi:hypothetical protein